jgi:alpha-mannosidase
MAETAVAPVFETAGWRLELDPATGAIRRLVNRAHGQPLFTGPAHRALVVDDPTDTWSHGVDRLGFDGADLRCERIAVVEHGPLRTCVEVIARHGETTLATLIVLPEAADLAVDLHVSLHWREQRRLLRLAYPLSGSSFEAEIAAGWITLPNDGREVAAQRWVRAARPGLAVALVNDAKYSYATLDGTLFITAVRSPPYAHHDPLKLEPGVSYRCLDQGEQRFTLRLQGTPTLLRQDALRMAERLLRPPVISPHVARHGTRPWRGTWLDVAATGASVTTLKASEDGQALILRALDTEGTGGTISCGDSKAPVSPLAIATVRLIGNALTPSNGLEL